MTRHRKRTSFALFGSTVALCVLASTCALAKASEGSAIRVFDPGMSLIGNCSISAEDSVPDPGCPGGAHPPKPFWNPCDTVTDSYGDVYVDSTPPGQGSGGRIDVFNAKGEYLTEIKEEHGPCNIAVDSEGNLYVLERESESAEKRVLLFTPSSYPPQVGTSYPTEAEAVVVHPTPSTSCGSAASIAVDPSNDHLYINVECEGILDYGSAADNLPAGNWAPINVAVPGGFRSDYALGGGFDVYGRNHAVYAAGFAASSSNGGTPPAQRIYVFDGTTGEMKCESNGSETPKGHFSFAFGNAAVAVDQSSGDFYVDDTKANTAVDRFDPGCHYLDQLPSGPPTLQHPNFRAGLAVDDPCLGVSEASCDLGGYHSPNEGTVYVGSGNAESSSHLFAFPLREPGPPEIKAQAATEITDTEARLEASLNPHAVKTTYHFEYISQADYEADGEEFGTGAQSVPVADADAGQGGSFSSVIEPISGLQPDTAYRFRLVATNCGAPNAIEGECLTRGEGNVGGDGEDSTFTTYLPEAEGLPDSRGYELVTPPDTGGYLPTMNELGFSAFGAQAAFATDFAGPGGDSVVFGIEGGSMPGFAGGGFHDTYEAHREADGHWRTEFNGIDGAEAKQPTPNGFSTDRAASFWTVRRGASAVEGNYIRRSGGVLDPACSPEPAGKLEVIGCGSLGTDPRVHGGWVSPAAGHVIFATRSLNTTEAQQLEPQAAPTGTNAVYDRTADGVTHVVSLKPGNVPFAQDEDAEYEGSSSDGTAVAFKVDGTLYVRLDDEKTVEVAEGDPTFGGLSGDGSRIIYLRPNSGQPLLPGTQIPQGDVFVCKVRSSSCAGSDAQAPIQIGSGQKSILVNVSADGSHIYFTSTAALTLPEEENENHEHAEAERDNLYVWDAESEAVRFIAIVGHADVTGRDGFEGQVNGLGLWVPYAVAPSPGPHEGPAGDPSRTTPDGRVFVFESHTDLNGYESDGHAEVYRYDTAAEVGKQLTCLSCNPTGVAAGSDAELESNPPSQFISLPPVNGLAQIANVTADGNRVFFQSSERLVLRDTDGKLDVYEWKAQGTGGCLRAAGCVFLLSSGHSATDDYLYAMTPDGSNVFFESGDLLVTEDHDSTPSIYDARIGGGAASEVPPSAECLGEACQPAAVAPDDVTPPTASAKPGNPVSATKHSCARGKRAVRVKGKGRCVSRHARQHHKRKRAHANRRAAR